MRTNSDEGYTALCNTEQQRWHCSSAGLRPALGEQFAAPACVLAPPVLHVELRMHFMNLAGCQVGMVLSWQSSCHWPSTGRQRFFIMMMHHHYPTALQVARLLIGFVGPSCNIRQQECITWAHHVNDILWDCRFRSTSNVQLHKDF